MLSDASTILSAANSVSQWTHQKTSNDEWWQMIMTVIITSFYWCLCPDDESRPGPHSEDQTLSPGARQWVLGQALRAASARAKGGCGGERGRGGATLFSWVSILGASGGCCSDGSIMLELTFSDESDDYDVRPRRRLMWPLALFELLPAS